MNVVKTNLQYTQPLTPLNPDNIRFIILHHPAAVTYSPEQCHADHLAKGWAGAGYNEYIRKDGTVYLMRGDHVGAQCLNYNSISYGICCEGDYDRERTMPQVQYDSLVARLKYHKGRFPGAKIVGHRELCSTSCPGEYFPLRNVIEAADRMSTPLDNALAFIHEKVSIDVNLWAEKCKTVPYLDVLLIKIANAWKEGK